MKKLIQVFLWPIIDVPKSLFITFKRLTILLEHVTSFILNIKLFFVPLFGDYSYIGRVIGIVYRVLKIFFGLILLVFLWICTLTIPLLWYAIPFLLYYFFGYTFFNLYISAIYVLSIVKNFNIPIKKVSKNKKNKVDSFRTTNIRYIFRKNINGKKAFGSLLKKKSIINLLIKSELYNNQFTESLLKNQNFNRESIINNAYDLAKKHNSKYVEVEHVFYSFLNETDKIRDLLMTHNSNLEDVQDTIKWIVGEKNKNFKKYIWQDDFVMPPEGGISRGLTGKITPILDSFSEDYTVMAKKGLIKSISHREKEVEEIAKLLSGGSANVLLVGNSGSGKTTIVKSIAYQIIKGTNYKSLDNKRVVNLNIGKLLTGTKTSGEVATKMTLALEEIKDSKDIILFIDDLHELIKGNSDLLNVVYSILEPYINSSNIQFLATTTGKEFRKYIEPISSFSRLFNIVNIEDATIEQSISILEERTEEYEKQYKVNITYPAIKTCVNLSEKLIHQRVLPDKALLILSTASSKNTNSLIDTNIIKKELAEYTNLPIENINQDDTQKILNLEKTLKKTVIGQDLAITKLSNAITRARVGIRNDKKPIASFMFIGSTGVGKTQTAKSLANYYFGGEKNMIRLDMSEYQQLDSLNRLIGNPDGQSVGILTEQIRSNPYTLILMDEIEKAHEKVILTFLQVLDDGRLTDNMGTTLDFTNTIIIATTNIGTKKIQELSKKGLNFETIEQQALVEVRNHFAPEFLNRFTDLIVFHTLSIDNLKQITKIELKKVEEILNQKGIKVLFKPELINELIVKGYNLEWGARPLEKVIEDNVETYVAEKILRNAINPGDTLELGLEVFNK